MAGIWVCKDSYWHPSSGDVQIAKRRSAQLQRTYADTLAHALYNDMMSGEGDRGSFYLDGRKIEVGTPKARDLFSVGGAHDSLVLEDGEVSDENSVRIAVELLHDVMVQLQNSAPDDPVCVSVGNARTSCGTSTFATLSQAETTPSQRARRVENLLSSIWSTVRRFALKTFLTSLPPAIPHTPRLCVNA